MIRNIPRLYHFRPLTLKLISSLQPFAARSSEIYAQIDNLISSSNNNITSSLATLHNESLKVASQADIYDQLTACVQEIKSLEELKARCEGLRSAMAEDRITEKEVELMILENKAVEALLPATEQDEQNAIMEIKLMDLNTSNKFVNDLVEMYTHFADSLGWDCNLVTSKQIDHNGLSEAILNIEGMNVYKSLKYEMGVHRAFITPEIPIRASVAVIPHTTPDDFDIPETDLQIQEDPPNIKGRKPGVRITHIPTGISVSFHSLKSVSLNRLRALSHIRSRVYTATILREDKKILSSKVKELAQSSQNIRTYYISNSLITDHRTNLTLYGLESMLNGTMLGELINAHENAEREKLIKSLLESNQ